MNEINGCYIDNPNDFIKWWNSTIELYGVISIAEVRDVLGLCENRLYPEYKCGWTDTITTDNFEIDIFDYHIGWKVACKLNLPEVKELD